MATLSLLLALLVTLAPGAAAQTDDAPGRVVRGVPARSLTVTHGPVVTTLTTAGSDGHQLGDLRVVSIPLTGSDGSEAGRIDASLLTTSIDATGPGDEVRISTLVFTLGDDPADQVVVMGTGIYPAAGSTIAVDSTVVRPIVGGSGAFAGATGWAETEHLDDDSWRHTLHLEAAQSGRAAIVPPGHLRRQRMHREPAPATGATEDQAIVRTLLGSSEPDAAAGETLGLWHYVIPAGSTLPVHTHPGDQVARIVRGTLTYEVVAGEAHVIRGDGSSETIGSGDVVELAPGDSITEPAGMVHFASNAGRRPVEIVSATLFETGAEPATVVEASAEPVTADGSLAPTASATP
jgi:quercetin dioxygenase-like cupin family protein